MPQGAVFCGVAKTRLESINGLMEQRPLGQTTPHAPNSNPMSIPPPPELDNDSTA